MEKIVIYEPQCKGIEHVPFNKCMIKMLKKINPSKKLLIYGDKEHIKLLKMEIEATYEDLDIAGIVDTKKNKIFKEIKNIFKLRKNKDEIYFLSVTPLTVIFAKIFLRKNTKIFIWHSVLESLMEKNSFFSLNYWIKPAIMIKDKKSINIVLGQSISDNLLKFFPQLSKNFYSIDHPYEFQIEQQIKNEFSDKIKIGTIGFATEKKGTPKIFEIEKGLENANIQLEIIGDTQSINIPLKTNVITYGGKGALDRDTFDRLIRELDFALYLYPKDMYKLFASGAIFDSILNLKPIIALKNNYFEYIFKKIGDIGYLCEDYNEIIEIIKKIENEKDNEKYVKQQENLLRGQSNFFIDNVAKDFEKIIEKLRG